jgi:hypothetical protein
LITNTRCTICGENNHETDMHQERCNVCGCKHELGFFSAHCQACKGLSCPDCIRWNRAKCERYPECEDDDGTHCGCFDEILCKLCQFKKYGTTECMVQGKFID